MYRFKIRGMEDRRAWRREEKEVRTSSKTFGHAFPHFLNITPKLLNPHKTLKPPKIYSSAPFLEYYTLERIHTITIQ